MSIYVSGDPEFKDQQHASLGTRLFTVSHSSRDAKIAMGIGIAVIVLGVPFIILGRDTMMLIGFLMCLVGPLFIVFGIVQMIRARGTTHVYELGVLQELGGDLLEVRFDSVTAAKLNFTEVNTTLGMRFILTAGDEELSFSDGATLLNLKDRERMHAIVEFVSESLPSSVKVRGDHALPKRDK